jgi:phosphatidylglycerophosphatase A
MCLISLLFFRFFDIVKPFPINEVDKINSNFGVILDDILAGFFSAIFLTLILNL